MKGLVLASGGTRCAFQVGVIKAFHELGLEFDIGAAASGGVPNLFYYFAGHLDRMEHVWQERITTRKFVNLFRIFIRRPLMDIRYLVYHIFRELPFSDYEKVDLGRSIIFPLYNITDKKIEYLDFQSGTYQEVLDFLFAAMTAPFINDQCLEKGGKLYCDGAFVDPCPYEQVVMRGAKKIVVVGTRFPNERDFPAWFIRLWFPYTGDKIRAFVRRKVLRALQTHDNKVTHLINSNHASTIIILPKSQNRFKYHLLNNSPKVMKELVELGYNTVMQDEELKKKLIVQFSA